MKARVLGCFRGKVCAPAALIVGFALLVLVGCGSSGRASTPTPARQTQISAAATPSPVETAAATAALAGSALDKTLREIEDRVLAIRGLGRPEPVPHFFVDQDTMRAHIEEELEDPEAVEALRMNEKVLKLLGLVPQDADLAALYRLLLGSQVLGLYDDEAKEFLVLQTGATFGVAEETTYAHEYVHRIQDAHFDLAALLDSAAGADPSSGTGRGDRESAISALVEGDATAVQSAYMLRHVDFREMAGLLRLAREAQELTQGIPFVLQRGLEFPYNEGAAFVTTLQSRGGFEAVDAAFARLPETTEQVLHPAKYFQGEGPRPVALPGEDAFGDGWTVAFAESFGEFSLRVWLEAFGVGSSQAAAAAAGWGGDAYRLYSGSGGAAAMLGVIVWDSPATDAGEFFNALSAALADEPGFTAASPVLSSAVEFLQGPGGVIGHAVATPPGSAGPVTVIAVAPDVSAVARALESITGSQ